jgi:hypothetical protein
MNRMRAGSLKKTWLSTLLAGEEDTFKLVSFKSDHILNISTHLLLGENEHSNSWYQFFFDSQYKRTTV